MNLFYPKNFTVIKITKNAQFIPKTNCLEQYRVFTRLDDFKW